MPLSNATRWTDERVAATVTEDLITSQLRSWQRDLLHKPLAFGEGLTDDTYLDWILDRAKKIYLILAEIGASDQIFRLVDSSCEDDDLPLSLGNIEQLRLLNSQDRPLSERFHKAQFNFLVRELREGVHIDYSPSEIVPVELVVQKVNFKSPARLPDGCDKVLLPHDPSRVYARKEVKLDAYGGGGKDVFLEDVLQMKQLTHDHLVSMHASYSQENLGYVLSTPIPDLTLRSFLSDPPKSFLSLEKLQRRQILFSWPHCIASALNFIHREGYSHGRLTPSQIFVDDKHRVFLGCPDALAELDVGVKVKDGELYDYAPPERWIRTGVMQETKAFRSAPPSGGRTGRKTTKAQSDTQSAYAESSTGSSNSSSGDGSADSFSTQSSYSSYASSDSYPCSPSENEAQSFDYAYNQTPPLLSGPHSMSSSTYQDESSATTSSRSSDAASTIRHPASDKGRKRSMNGSGSSGRTPTGLPNIDPSALHTAVPAAHFKKAIVSTWHASPHSPFASDIFVLGAITLDILCVLFKKKLSAFATYRGHKNRTAGRGGGAPDCSFHANLGAVGAWMDQLNADAYKKRNEDIFAAAPLFLTKVQQMIDRSPSQRPTAGDVELEFCKAVVQGLGRDAVHCKPSEAVQPKPQPQPVPRPQFQRSRSDPRLPQEGLSFQHNQRLYQPQGQVQPRHQLDLDQARVLGGRQEEQAFRAVHEQQLPERNHSPHLPSRPQPSQALRESHPQSPPDLDHPQHDWQPRVDSRNYTRQLQSHVPQNLQNDPAERRRRLLEAQEYIQRQLMAFDEEPHRQSPTSNGTRPTDPRDSNNRHSPHPSESTSHREQPFPLPPMTTRARPHGNRGHAYSNLGHVVQTDSAAGLKEKHGRFEPIAPTAPLPPVSANELVGNFSRLNVRQQRSGRQGTFR